MEIEVYMNKTNFSKVEKSLEEGMIKIKSQNLLKEADAYTAKEFQDKIPSKEECSAMITRIERDLKKLSKQDEKVYKKIGFHKMDLKKLLSNPSLVSPQEWKTIKEIKARIEKYKKELASLLPFESDEDLVESQRSRHLTKRFNINEKWIPLDKNPL